MNTEDNSAYQRLQVISQDDLKRMEYEARMKAVRDYNQGRLESKEEGIEIGIVKGREEGRQEAQKKMIKSLFRSMSVEEIAEAVDMPVSYIKRVIES